MIPHNIALSGVLTKHNLKQLQLLDYFENSIMKVEDMNPLIATSTGYSFDPPVSSVTFHPFAAEATT